jgi:hypothetical protein
MNESSGNDGKNQKNKCFYVGSQEISVRSVQKLNITIWPARLFLGHAGEDCAYMMEELQAHKKNRDWHLDSSSSNNIMSDEEDVDHLDNHNTNNIQNNNNNNNEGLNINDFVETEDYEPRDPDGFDQQIIDIFSCNHDNLISRTIPAVNTIISCWNIRMYCWHCFNCNQQLLSTGQGDVWKCPTFAIT